MDGMAMPVQRSQEMMSHLNDVTYPASKDDLVKACDGMSDVPEVDKRWFVETLPEKNYQSSDEVKQALGFTM